MGEIKSTLDIIMEKAKAISVTDEEKEAFQRKEIEGKARGFLQKVFDGFMDVEGLKNEMENLNEKQQKIVREFIKNECLNKVEPEKDNRTCLGILDLLSDVDTKPILRIISEFNRDLVQARGKIEFSLQERLEKAGISGSAVIPNFRADPEWIEYATKKREEFFQKLSSLTQDKT